MVSIIGGKKGDRFFVVKVGGFKGGFAFEGKKHYNVYDYKHDKIVFSLGNKESALKMAAKLNRIYGRR